MGGGGGGGGHYFMISGKRLFFEWQTFYGGIKNIEGGQKFFRFEGEMEEMMGDWKK